ncbi:hypothetical protein, partial [Intestinimonas butyriciproducens]|uniref:hypothetical protein n=1 Tax=Intestinimonas butyriciproducens TaxID=1297617 RepID=UPI00195B9096
PFFCFFAPIFHKLGFIPLLVHIKYGSAADGYSATLPQSCWKPFNNGSSNFISKLFFFVGWR